MRIPSLAALFVALALAALGWTSLARAQEQSFTLVQRGKALTDAGDCIACHTNDPARPFAGGRPIETPFGIIYSANLTPDRDTGIGAWSDDDFYRAMHEGVGPDGTKLYPAFPYPYFTRMTRDDVLAVRAYLNTLAPVNNPRPANKLRWPLNHRILLIGWNMLFFTPGEFKPDPDKSADWNRGAYLVQGAGHCGACHTEKNAFGGDKRAALQGGQLQNWFVPNITNDRKTGIGSWSEDEIVEYLKTGRNRHSGASALMAEVVADSTSRMSDKDLKAIAVYLKDVPGGGDKAPIAPDQSVMNAGQAIYIDSCAACHGSDGKGAPHMFPPLAKNANVQSEDPTTIIRAIVEGLQTVQTDARPTASAMPAYGWKLSDTQIAAVATYVRNNWGNAAPAVTPGQVQSLKKQLSPATH